MASENESYERAKQLVSNCPKGHWIVHDHEQRMVYYKSQTPPHDIISTDHTTNDVSIAHQVFIPPADKYHIALDQHDPANTDKRPLHYSPV